MIDWRVGPVLIVAVLSGAHAHASELSYTFMDFQYVASDVQAAGSQAPVPNQVVSVASGSGDGIAVAGSFALSPNLHIGGAFESSIIDVEGTVENPLGVSPLSGDYDLTISQLSLGYRHWIGTTFDLLLELTYDSANYDFGSFAGESFDVEDGGAGARLGFRWNPATTLELYMYAHYSPVGRANLDRLEMEDDTLMRAGFMWYFFRDLGLGFDYESGAVDTMRLSMRFSFGELALR